MAEKTYSQLQFPFMKFVNMYCYIQKEYKYMSQAYDFFLHHYSQPLSFNAFLEQQYCVNKGLYTARTYSDSWRNHFFKDLENIVTEEEYGA